MSRFRQLHAEGCFVMPNPWDRGSAKRLEALGFAAPATTSSGHAESLGRVDQQVTFDEMLEHAAEMVAAVSVPLNIAERVAASAVAARASAPVSDS